MDFLLFTIGKYFQKKKKKKKAKKKKKKKKEAKLKDSSIVLDVKLTPFILTSTQKKILM